MKICKKCKVLKNLGDFYKHDRMIDGHLNVCKNCTKKRISDYWYKNAKTLRIKERIRWQKRKLNPQEMKRRADYQKSYRVKNKKIIAIRQRKYRAQHKDIIAAYNQVHRKLIAPEYCEICGECCKPHGHHADYNKPLEVIWVCSVCHRGIHSKLMIAGEKL